MSLSDMTSPKSVSFRIIFIVKYSVGQCDKKIWVAGHAFIQNLFGSPFSRQAKFYNTGSNGKLRG